MFGKRLSMAIATALPVFAVAPAAPASDASTSTSEPTTEDLAALAEALAWDAIWDVHDTAEMDAALENAGLFLSSDGTTVQSLQDNTVTDLTTGHSALIEGSFNESTGAIGVNQSAGTANNQANVYAAAFGSAEIGALRVNDADVVQRLQGNSLTTNVETLTAGIHDSFNNTAGIVGVNQAAGNLNNQANVVALTFGGDAGPAATLLDEAALAQVGEKADNSHDEQTDTDTSATITNSFNNFKGVAQVNQVAGNLNQVANVVGVSVNVNR